MEVEGVVGVEEGMAEGMAPAVYSGTHMVLWGNSISSSGNLGHSLPDASLEGKGKRRREEEEKRRSDKARTPPVVVVCVCVCVCVCV